MDLSLDVGDLLAAMATRPLRLGLGFRTVTREGSDVGWHGHDLLELVYHHRGAGEVQAEGHPAVAYVAGDIDVHAPRIRHRQPCTRSGEDWCLHLVLPCRWPASLPALIHLAARPVVIADLASLTEHPGAELPPAATLARNLRAGALLAEALAGIGAAPQVGRGPDPAQACREIIDQRFASIGRIEDLATEVGLGPDRLRHLFTARFGHGPRAYLRQVRLRAAQRLLAETPLGLAEIASRCGIGNARQLCDLFRAVVGTTPGSWRKLAAKAGQMTPRKPSR